MNTGFWFIEIPWRPLGDRVVSSRHPVYVTGDIGDNHNGELDNALALIDHAASAGCNAVKFTKGTPEISTPRDQWELEVDTPWGRMGYLAYRQRMELDEAAYAAIDRHARARGIAWFAAVQDLASVDFLEQFDVAAHMVDPGCLADDELLRRLRDTGRTVLVPTQKATMHQIRHAVDMLGSHNILLSHGASTRPAAAGQLNLRMLRTLQEEFPDVPIGYSGHETGLQTTLAAVAMGAVFVERHLTLDRAMWGSNQAASMEPPAMQRLVHDIRVISDALGDGLERIYDDQEPELATGGVFAPNPAA